MDNLVIYICCVSIIVIALAIAIFILLMIIASKYNNKIIAENGQEVTATVVGVKYYKARKWYRVLAYYKNPQTGQEHTYKSHNSFRRKPDVTKGEKVKIQVYPKNSKFYLFNYEE